VALAIRRATLRPCCRTSCDESGGPGGLQVIAAHWPGDIEDFPAKVEPTNEFGFHRLAINLVQRDSTCHDLAFLDRHIANRSEWPILQSFEKSGATPAIQTGALEGAINVRAPKKGSGQPIGYKVANKGGEWPSRVGGKPLSKSLGKVIKALVWRYVHLEIDAPTAGALSDFTANAEGTWPGDPVVGEQEIFAPPRKLVARLFCLEDAIAQGNARPGPGLHEVDWRESGSDFDQSMADCGRHRPSIAGRSRARITGSADRQHNLL
jgi:hypothetical protein